MTEFTTLQLIIDVRGYRPEELKCVVEPQKVQVVAEKNDTTNNPAKANTSIKRSYKLNQPVVPTKAICCLSAEGILLIAVPWG